MLGEPGQSQPPAAAALKTPTPDEFGANSLNRSMCGKLDPSMSDAKRNQNVVIQILGRRTKIICAEWGTL